MIEDLSEALESAKEFSLTQEIDIYVIFNVKHECYYVETTNLILPTETLVAIFCQGEGVPFYY